jgi:hypothetical protein
MMDILGLEGGGWIDPVLDGPPRVLNSLVIQMPERVAARAMESIRERNLPEGGAEDIAVFLKQHENARLDIVHGDSRSPAARGTNLELAAPGAEKFATFYHLSHGDFAALAGLKERLERHAGFQAHFPAILHPVDAPPGVRPPGPAEEQWGLKRCGFEEVWDHLDHGPSPGPIAVIDQGPAWPHPELDGRVTTRKIGASTRKAPRSAHASAVAGVIAARRDDGGGVSGCCSAEIYLYNVWASDHDFDSVACCEALRDVVRSGVRVVNFSIGTLVDDPMLRRQIQECVQSGVIVVAAMGNLYEKLGNPPIYPAAYDGVIAVGATTPDDVRAAWSGTGSHIDISAPGENIETTLGDSRRHLWSGTSFAAPMVSAAVWLALRARPCWGLAEIQALLVDSTAGGGTRTDDLGHGRLDMGRLLRALHAMPRHP